MEHSEKKISVLQLIDSLQTGGAEMMAVNLANGLARAGVSSCLVATRKEGALKSKINAAVTYRFLNKNHTLDLTALWRLRKFCRQEKINTIHAHSSSFFLASLLKGTLPGIRIVWHDHYGNSEQLQKRSSWVLKKCAPYFAAGIVVNQALKGWAVKQLKIAKVEILPNFVAKEAETAGETFLRGEANKRIVCVANLRPQKDHLNLLKAFKRLREHNKEWTLHLVGADWKDNYSERLKAFVKNQQLTKHVYFYGSCTDIPFILSQATVGVLASKSEGLPLALLDYGMAKLGVVVTDVGDCSVVVKNGESGWLVPPKEELRLAEKLVLLLENKKEREQMGECLHQTIKAQFAEDVIIKQLISIYQELE